MRRYTMCHLSFAIVYNVHCTRFSILQYRKCVKIRACIRLCIIYIYINLRMYVCM